MVLNIWEFQVDELRAKDFERFNGPSGAWYELFQGSKDFVRTELYRDPHERNRYVTVDTWESIEAFQQYKEEKHAEYKTLSDENKKHYLKARHVGFFRKEYSASN